MIIIIVAVITMSIIRGDRTGFQLRGQNILKIIKIKTLSRTQRFISFSDFFKLHLKQGKKLWK